MYQQKIKRPYWELERVNDNKTVTFSSRNTGCADFVCVPVEAIAEAILKAGLLVKCDVKGHFIEVLSRPDPNIPYHGQ